MMDLQDNCKRDTAGGPKLVIQIETIIYTWTLNFLQAYLVNETVFSICSHNAWKALQCLHIIPVGYLTLLEARGAL